MPYKGFLVDEEKDGFTVWEPRGIYWLGTFSTVDEAKQFVDNNGEKEVARIKSMLKSNNR